MARESLWAGGLLSWVLACVVAFLVHNGGLPSECEPELSSSGGSNDRGDIRRAGVWAGSANVKRSPSFPMVTSLGDLQRLCTFDYFNPSIHVCSSTPFQKYLWEANPSPF